MKSSLKIKISKYSGKESELLEDIIAMEEPLEIQLVYGDNEDRIIKTISITMRTPGNDKELAAGFLFTEGIIQNADQINEIKTLPFDENKILVSLTENVRPDLKNSERNFYTSSQAAVSAERQVLKRSDRFPFITI
jgi:FdhD protein